MQFIYSKKQALSSKLCQNLIDKFEQSPLKKQGSVRFQGTVAPFPEFKQSTDITFDPSFEQDEYWNPELNNLIHILHKGLDEYYLKFSDSLTRIAEVRLDTYFNIQRYLPQEAYHSWHCERGGLETGHRVLVWMFYLNNVTDKGETEFYFQNHKETPEEGKLIIWPSDWTHLHRGITSPTQTKYIVTGWFSHFS